MYKIMVIFSWIVRQVLIPNPFEALGEGMQVNIYGNAIVLSPDVLNWIIGFVLPGLAYGITGIYYDKGSAPALGSFLYLFFYCVHNFLLWVMSLAGCATWAVILIIVLYVGSHVALIRFKNRYFLGLV